MRKSFAEFSRPWNTIYGCTRVSSGCTFCTGESIAPGISLERSSVLSRVAGRYNFNGKIWFDDAQLNSPINTVKIYIYMLNFHGDTLHENVRMDDLASLFNVMSTGVRLSCSHKLDHAHKSFISDPDNRMKCWKEVPRHLYIIPTKRPERMRIFNDWVVNMPWSTTPLGVQISHSWPHPRVMLAASIEDQRSADQRIPELISAPVKNRAILYQPALGRVDLSPWIKSIDWVLVGGETSLLARGSCINYMEEVVDLCLSNKVPVFVEGLGEKPFVEHPARVPNSFKMCKITTLPAINNGDYCDHHMGGSCLIWGEPWYITDKNGVRFHWFPKTLRYRQLPMVDLSEVSPHYDMMLRNRSKHLIQVSSRKAL